MRGKPLVVYDGTCGICGGNLKWLHRLDWFRRFDALPYQSDDVYRTCPQLTREACEQALQVVLGNGRVYSGADAFREVFLRMPLAFPVGVLMALPPFSWLLRKLYPILAKNRYRLGGHCRLRQTPRHSECLDSMAQGDDVMSLHEACYQGRIDVVVQLLASGANPNEPADASEREWISSAGNRPKPLNCVAIAWTMTENHVKIARLLIEHGAVVDDSVLHDHIIESASDPTDFASTDFALRGVLEAARNIPR